MAFIPGFEYDIFISYAHTDNLTSKPEEVRWVEQFHEDLRVGLARLIGRTDKVKIWRDEKLDGSQLFDQVIQNRINQSAIFLALNSPGYRESDYCQQELRRFHQKAQAEKAGLHVGERMRIFNVLLYNIPYDQWPIEFGHTSGFPFHIAKSSEDLGAPLDVQEKNFKTRMGELVTAVVQLLNSFATAPSPIAPPPDEAHGVYIAEVADSLRTIRKRVINELSQKAIKVYKTIPPPYEPREHEQAVRAAMKEAKLSVHLLDQLGGPEIEGEVDTTYPRKQAHLGMENAKFQLIWVPSNLEIPKVEDEQQKVLLDQLENGIRKEARYEFVRGMPNEIVQLIIEKMEQLKGPAKPAGVPSAALLDMHKKDQRFAWDLSRFLEEKNIQPYINPEDDDPESNVTILKERLKQVGALIIFYGLVSGEWVRARLAEAAKIVISENCPVNTFCIYLAPPEEGKADIRFDRPFFKLNLLDNRRGFNPDSLSPLLLSLGAGGAG